MVFYQFLVAGQFPVGIVGQHADQQRGRPRGLLAAGIHLRFDRVCRPRRCLSQVVNDVKLVAVWMSVPMAKARFTKPVPRPINELILVSPGVLRSTFSCGSMILASISSGAAARQKLAIDICGSSMFGSNWIGAARIDLVAEI